VVDIGELGLFFVQIDLEELPSSRKDHHLQLIVLLQVLTLSAKDILVKEQSNDLGELWINRDDFKTLLDDLQLNLNLSSPSVVRVKL
jgi:hypothetical protein